MTRRTYRTEHPHFPAMPEAELLIAAGWADQSWHNDTMPRFVNEAACRVIWVDHPDADQREDEGGYRFCVYAIDDFGDLVGDPLLYTDAAAKKFGALARAKSLPQKLAEIGRASCRERVSSPV